MNVPAKHSRKSRRHGYPLIIRITVARCLEHHRSARDLVVEPADRIKVRAHRLVHKDRCVCADPVVVLEDIPEPGINTLENISCREHDQNQCDNRKDPAGSSAAEIASFNHISHHHAEQDERLICQLEHRICAVVFSAVNILHIDDLGHEDESYRA